MEKPVWRVRASKYLVDSPHMRLRVDEVELPDGTVVADYYVREGAGFVSVLPLTGDGRVVLVRQYRYASDTMQLELPGGTLDLDEEPVACARRELLEETGYEAERFEPVATYAPEPVRATARAHVFLAFGAHQTRQPELDPTEHLAAELVALAEFRSMLRKGAIEAGSSLVAGYRALDHLGLL
jgi:8-oxo-dGTP pyrophosphatase MutT (NUDIX family)